MWYNILLLKLFMRNRESDLNSPLIGLDANELDESKKSLSFVLKLPKNPWPVLPYGPGKFSNKLGNVSGGGRSGISAYGAPGARLGWEDESFLRT